MPPSDPVEAPESNNVEGGDAPVEEQEIVEPGEGEPAEGEVAEGGDVYCSTVVQVKIAWQLIIDSISDNNTPLLHLLSQITY